MSSLSSLKPAVQSTKIVTNGSNDNTNEIELLSSDEECCNIKIGKSVNGNISSTSRCTSTKRNNCFTSGACGNKRSRKEEGDRSCKVDTDSQQRKYHFLGESCRRKGGEDYIDLTCDSFDEGELDCEKTCNSSSSSTFTNAKQIESIHLYKDDGDNGTCTPGILSLLVNLSFCTTGMATMMAPASVPRSTNNSLKLKRTESSYHHVPLHIQQNDKWSCGYRNLQMILSSLIPQLPSYHPFRSLCHFQPKNSCNNTITNESIPSIKQIQTQIEQSWSENFDTKGAEHYRYQIYGQPSKIGAVEVSSVLSYLHIDSTLVQFIVCPASRTLLGNFVWRYFDRQFWNSACIQYASDENIDGSNLRYNSTSCVVELLRLASSTTDDKDDGKGSTASAANIRSHPLMPLYLQWEGHSVTVVGIEKSFNKMNVDGKKVPEYNLLLLDPMKNGSAFKQELATHLQKYLSKADSITTNPTCRSCELDCLQPMRLPAKNLLNKDCQIVVCTPRPLEEKERETCKIRTNALTAALVDVEQVWRKKVRRQLR